MDASKVDGWWRKASQTLFAARCLLCSEPGLSGQNLCAECRGALPWNDRACLHCAIPLPAPGACGECLQRPPPLAETHAAFLYGFPLDRLVPQIETILPPERPLP